MRRAKTTFTLLSLLLISLQLWSTTVRPLSVEELAGLSSEVVLGRALSAESRWDSEHKMIYTYTRFRVEKALKGSPAQEITVKQMGGSADGYTLKVSGVKHWSKGESAVLFLQRTATGERRVTGLTQGNFAVRKSASGELVVSNGVPDVRTFDAKSGSVTNYKGMGLTMGELEQRVSRTLGRQQ